MTLFVTARALQECERRMTGARATCGGWTGSRERGHRQGAVEGASCSCSLLLGSLGWKVEWSSCAGQMTLWGGGANQRTGNRSHNLTISCVIKLQQICCIYTSWFNSSWRYGMFYSKTLLKQPPVLTYPLYDLFNTHTCCVKAQIRYLHIYDIM